jgi:hypothetical protein
LGDHREEKLKYISSKTLVSDPHDFEVENAQALSSDKGSYLKPDHDGIFFLSHLQAFALITINIVFIYHLMLMPYLNPIDFLIGIISFQWTLGHIIFLRKLQKKSILLNTLASHQSLYRFLQEKSFFANHQRVKIVVLKSKWSQDVSLWKGLWIDYLIIGSLTMKASFKYPEEIFKKMVNEVKSNRSYMIQAFIFIISSISILVFVYGLKKEMYFFEYYFPKNLMWYNSFIVSLFFVNPITKKLFEKLNSEVFSLKHQFLKHVIALTWSTQVILTYFAFSFVWKEMSSFLSL